jgi:hypothetical protein
LCEVTPRLDKNVHHPPSMNFVMPSRAMRLRLAGLDLPLNFRDCRMTEDRRDLVPRAPNLGQPAIGRLAQIMSRHSGAPGRHRIARGTVAD